jgi:hypothetical protein
VFDASKGSLRWCEDEAAVILPHPRREWARRVVVFAFLTLPLMEVVRMISWCFITLLKIRHLSLWER